MADKPCYKFQGPLDPGDPNQVCNYRESDVTDVIQGIVMGDYWMILGPRQIGKTTFLHLVKKEFKEADYIYFDYEVAHKNEKKFYQWLIQQFHKEIPHQRIRRKFKTIKGDSPALSFFDFLKNFRPKKEIKIILLFDEIDGLPFLRNFLHLWRKVFHERYGNQELSRYTVITTGSVELVKLASGPNSPFNIARTFYIKDLSEEESKKIIEEPFAKLGIKIEPKAEQKLLSQISGHPQLLQHACHILEQIAKQGVEITEERVDMAIKRLFTENTILKTLQQDIAKDEKLRNLTRDILIAKKETAFDLYSAYAILGAGAIKEENSLCKIRNPVYEKFIEHFLNVPMEKFQMEISQSQKEGSRKKKKKKIKFLIVAIGILAIIMLALSMVVKNPFTRLSLTLGSGMFAAVAVGGLISLSPGENNENANKNN